MFSANLRSPSDISTNERQSRVEQVLQELGLQKCAQTRIGTELARGVSGGERKRTCIGMELVLQPKILFLDEPTTGLDASTARTVMFYLHQLSTSGRTIIFSIHQPRYSIFKLFDKILLISKGSCVYQGPSKDLSNYFASQGYVCELHDNPADFVLDILVDEEQSTKLIKIHENLDKKIDSKEIPNLQTKRILHREIFHLTVRTMRTAFRNPRLLLSQMLTSIILGFLVGIVFYQMKPTFPNGTRNRSSAIFFCVVCQILTTLTAIEPLLKDRVLFMRVNNKYIFKVLIYRNKILLLCHF